MTTEQKIKKQLTQQADFFWKAFKDLRQGRLSLKATTIKAKEASYDR